MIERNVKEGDIVKMNPFQLDDARRLNCEFFEGERVVTRITASGSARVEVLPRSEMARIAWSNFWKRRNLLIKGVDYDVE
jgi:hypothetical protein